MNTFLKCYNKNSYESYTLLPICKTEHEVTYEGICCVQYINKEIEKYVSDTLAEREREQKRINDVLEIKKLKKEKEEYERLKKKFEEE